MKTRFLAALGVGALFFTNQVFATNPLITDQFTADPTARVFEGKVYVYPSHDIPYSPGKGRTNWFVMEDYHVFSSENLNDWTDHGMILNQTNVPWLSRPGYDMWAPDCVFKNGKYYFYFPVGGRIGVAIADKPYGPFKPEQKAIDGAGGIDPCVLLAKDGSAYLFWARGRISVAKLKDNMVELDSTPIVITNLPTKGLIEGPFAFERNGIYYLTYPHANTNTERLEYSTSKSPMGPYEPKGVILDESPSGCWTVHQSMIEYKGQWYLFYHDKDLSPDFDKNRAIRAEYMYFNDDGTIKKVTPTLRGVGIVDAKSKIQIDRYSAISPSPKGTLSFRGVSSHSEISNPPPLRVTVSFLDDANHFGGWKISLNGPNTWVRFDQVDFGKSGLKSVHVRGLAAAGGAVEIHLDKADGPLLAKVDIRKSANWQSAQSKLKTTPSGIHDLVVTHGGKDAVDLDWITFE